ncbi:TonB-dependent receptor domain-containing protein [Haoranjiania flava]|uniref:TonB-dependent receptor n=1 Tax=Haoranjiania flava TaxID=1856322 RepID=A0AAE3IM77_9BACT|nr:TonB-dependent receptor [Haoranjiania flava]MCU7694144.1 TonB-dependent receptor [Haoranjiania flava]
MSFKKSLQLFLMLLLPAVLFAQVTTSSITGTVVGPSGNPLTGASVTATHLPTGSVYKTITRTGGLFDLPGLRIGGPYVLEVSYVGFNVQKIDDIQLLLGQPLDLVVDMDESTVNAGNEVVVTSVRSRTAASVKTGAATILTNAQITAMPTISRSINDFTRLTPQANGNSFGGRDGRYNNLRVDGANLNNNFGLSSDLAPGGGSPISLDAFDEVSVSIAPFDVRQSGFTGAGINVVTKSGANQFHGSAYTYLRNQNSYGYKVNGTELTKTANSNTIVGATLGGPIIKNKLFFFVSGEYEKSSRPGINFTPAGSSFVGNPSNTKVEDLKKVYDFVKSKYNYDLGAYQNFPNFDENNRKILAKLDWNIDNSHKLTLKFSDYKGYQVSPLNGSSVPQNGPIIVTGQAKGVTRLPNNRFSANSMAFSSSNYATNRIVRSGTLELNSRFSPELSNQFLATYTKVSDIREPYGNKTVFPTVDIFNGAGQNFISFGTDPFTNNNQLVNDVINFTNNITYYAGRHTVTGGITYEHQKIGNMFMGGSQGHYAFNSLDDFLNEKAPAYYGYTYSLVPNKPAVFSAELKLGQLGAYLQDEYNITDKFKLTYGIRMDMPIYGEKPIANPKIDELQFPDKDGNIKSFSTGKWPKNRPLFSPRVGFNWDAMGDKSLTLRGGTGIFTGRIPFVFLTNMPSGSGMYQNAVRLNTAADLLAAGVTKFDPNPDAYAESPAFVRTAGTTVPRDFVLIDPDFRFPQIWRTNFGADKRLGNGYIATVDLIYTKDINAVVMRNPNLKAPTTQYTGADTRFYYPNGITTADTYYPAATVGTPIILENVNKGSAFSATAQLSKTFENGFFGSVAYTYSAAKEVSPNPGSRATSAWQSIYNVNGPNDKVLDNSQYAIPHRIIANASYRIEHGIFNFPTTLSLFYEGAHQGLISYNVNGSIVGDGNTELMYVYPSGADVPFIASTKYTVAQQQAAYDEFISNSKYLNSKRGQYVNRYGATSAWYNQIDFRFLQDLLVRKNEFGKTARVLQFSMDIFNIGNMLNSKWKNWGYRQTTTLTDPLQFKGVVNGAPTFNMREYGGALVTNPFTPNLSTYSTWSMQMGLKYTF